MITPSGKNLKRGVFDVKKSAAKSIWERLWEYIYGRGVINLRPKLRAKNPALVFGGAALIVVILVLGVRQILTRADVADFFPSACLGDWDNPHIAQGEPESFGGDGTKTDETNSAVYDSAKAIPLRIFCGKFLPDGFEPKGEIKNVGLTFVWRVGDAVPPTTEEPSQTSAEKEQATPIPAASENEEGSAPPPSETSPLENAEPQEEVVAPVEPQQDTSPANEENTPVIAPPSTPEASTSTTSLMHGLKSVLSFLGFRLAAAQEESPPPENVPIDPPLSAPSAENPTPVGGETSGSGETTQDTPPAETAPKELPPLPVSDEVIVAPPIEAKLEPVVIPTTDEDAGNMAQEMQVSEETGDVGELQTLEPLATFEPPPPPPPDENFLELSFSTNGNDWFELGKINPQNWQNFTIPISALSWEELKNLQIRLGGIETSLSQTPKVYLDGMFIEVHYELISAAVVVGGDADGDSETGEGQAQADSGQTGSSRSDIKIFDEGAAHKCSVEPFSREVRAGDLAIYKVSLRPSFENSYFELLTGDLPGGVSALFDPERGVGTSTPRLTLNVAESAERGSFGLVVVYREIDNRLEAKANFCQLNLVIE